MRFSQLIACACFFLVCVDACSSKSSDATEETADAGSGGTDSTGEDTSDDMSQADVKAIFATKTGTATETATGIWEATDSVGSIDFRFRLKFTSSKAYVTVKCVSGSKVEYAGVVESATLKSASITVKAEGSASSGGPLDCTARLHKGTQEFDIATNPDTNLVELTFASDGSVLSKVTD